MTLPKGGRLFTALVDLKITLAFLFIDSIRATPDGNSINRKDDINILSKSIFHLDDTFRTPEVHQTGRMCKWVLSSQDLFLDNEKPEDSRELCEKQRTYHA